MKPNNIFLVRHGESQGNVNREVYKKTPDYAVKLTEKGHNQASKVGQKIKKIIGGEEIYFYCSPYHRTRQTLHEIKKSLGHPCPTREEPRLREQEWSGSLRSYNPESEKERNDFGSFYYRFNGGESCADVYDRTSSFLDTLYRDFDKEQFPRNVGIVTHGMTIRVLLMRWFKYSVEEFEMLRNPANCCLINMELNSKSKYELKTQMKLYEKPSHPYQLKL